MQLVPVGLQNQYFAGWNPYSAQTIMFNPSSPFYPGANFMRRKKKKKDKKKKKKKKKKEKKKKEKKKSKSDSSSDSDSDAELFYVPGKLF